MLADADFLKEWGDTIPGCAFRRRLDIVGVVVIPAGFRKIGGMAFFGCFGLTELRFPDTLTEIGESAFWGCSRLAELRLPGSIESLGACAFSGCASLRLVAMHSVAQFATGYVGASKQFKGCTSLTAVSAPTEVASRFPADMFAGCGTAAQALLAAATADLALWYYWSRQSHLRCSPAAKDTVLAVMLVGLRLGRESESQLPGLPSDIWCWRLCAGMSWQRSSRGFMTRSRIFKTRNTKGLPCHQSFR